MFESQFITYAQNGEDVLLWRALKHVEKGFYIDVGAQDPVEYSVTKAFYERGWHGINVEPVQYWHDRLTHDRPHDINLHVAVSDRPGTLELYEVVDTGLSTSDPEFAKRHAADGRALHLFKVPCVTLDAICNDNQVDTVHFLKVDCEGAEKQVLDGFSFSVVRPWIVLVEATEPNSTAPTWQQWEHLLTRNAYRFVFFDGLNRYYVADEHEELARAFDAPVNVFDSARPIAAIEVEAEVRQLKRESEDLKSAEANGRLRAERDQLTAERNQVVAERDCVTAERDQVTVERDRVTAERDQVAAERNCVTTERDQVTVERDRVTAERDQVAAERNCVTTERDQVAGERDRVMAERDGLSSRLLASQREAATYRHAIAQLQQREAELLSSHSWRLSAPLRGASRVMRWTYQRLLRLVYLTLRPIAHLLRPSLRRLARVSGVRRVATNVLGRQSRVTELARIFLFGVGSSTGAAEMVGTGKVPDRNGGHVSHHSADRSSRGVRRDGHAASAQQPFDLEAAMEQIRFETTHPGSVDVVAEHGIDETGASGELGSVMLRVRAEVARRRAADDQGQVS